MANGVTNTQLMELSTKLLNAIHEQDSKLTESMNEVKSELINTISKMQISLTEFNSYRKSDYIKLMALDKDINGNGNKGIKYQNDTMWDKYLDHKDVAKEVKIAIILNVVTGLGLLANVFLG